MRIATWNVNGLRARIDFVLHWLEARQPDIVGFQELKLTDEQFPADVFEKLGYTPLVYGQKSWNGVAILSRSPARLVQRGLPGEDDFGARLVTARIEDLVFTTVYCPNGKTLGHDDYPKKLAWYESLLAHLSSQHDSSSAEVLCGDFNIVPHAIDGWDEPGHAGHIFHTDAERERFQALIDWGFRDLFREKNPDLEAFSWWDYRGGAFHRRQGLRIDLILGTAKVLERVREVTIDRDYRKKKDGLTASDHAPVIVDLD
jgi:exodeoxyribonuclease-3